MTNSEVNYNLSSAQLIYGSVLLLSLFIISSAGFAHAQADDSISKVISQEAENTTYFNHISTEITIGQQTFFSRAETLGDALQEFEIDIKSGQITKPHRFTSLTGGQIKVAVEEANIPVEIIDENRSYDIITGQSTVKNVLLSCNIQLDPKDKVYPGPDKIVKAGSKIIINRATPVIISYGKNSYELKTQATKISQAIEEAKTEFNLPPEPEIMSEINNENSADITGPGQEIVIPKISTEEITEYQDIPAPVEYEDDWNMYTGDSKTIATGSIGQKKVVYLVTYDNEVEIGRQQIQEEIITSPTAKKVAVGKKQPEYVAPAAPVPTGSGTSGTASWYKHGSTPACAHRTYPKGTRLLVTNNDTGASVVVVVNDYGPQAWTGRIIDLNSVAFAAIAPLSQGLARVTVQPL